MTKEQIEQKARELYPTSGRALENMYTHDDIQVARQDGFIAGHHFLNAQSTYDTDKLVECLRELVSAEWMVTHDWGGDRDTLLDNARTLLATFTDKKLEDEKEK